MNDNDVTIVKDRLVQLRGVAVPTDDVWTSIADRVTAPDAHSHAADRTTGRARWLVAAAVVLLLAGGAVMLAGRGGPEPEPLRTAGQGTSTTASPSRAGELSGTVRVSQLPGKAVRICVAELWTAGSECGGPEIVGWDWDAAGPSTTDLDGARSGMYAVTGRLDGDTFAVTSAAPATGGSDPEATDPPPCDAKVTDPSRMSPADFDSMLAAAEDLAGYAGEWYSRDVGAPPTPFDPSAGTESIAIAGDPDAARPQLEARWGGRLCLVPVDSSLRELEAVQGELDSFAERNGIDMLGIGIDVPANTVQVGVLATDPATQAAADAEFGPGLVSIVGLLAET